MIMQDNEKKPALRFKGFTDPWEQRKLGEMVDVCSGMDYKHLSEGDIPVYGTGGYMLSVNKALSYDRNAVGIGRKGTIDKPYILKAPFWTVDTLFYAIPKDSKNIDFTFDVFQKVDWKKKDESTGVPSLSKIAINETSISTPSKLEQERIGSFFRNLDTLITLHQRKYEKLVNIKKSMLDKMFPKNGASVPEIRFKGFTDLWEQRKLGELVEIGDIDHRMPETVADGIPYLMTGDFVGTNELNFDGTKMISEEDYCQLSQKIKPEKGDILFARYASVGAARYVDFTRKFLISYSCAIIKKSKKINSKYLYHFITSGKVQQQIKLEINTGSQANIGIDSMKNHIVVSMPPLEEQTKIADALSNLDHLITLHQRKLEKLQNIKKSCLEKMFV